MPTPRTLLSLAVAAGLLTGPGALAQTPIPPTAQQDLQVARALSRTFNRAAQTIAPSVVHVTQINEVNIRRGFLAPIERRAIQTGAGSGVIVSPDGYILTNNHVIENAQRVEVVMNDGRKLPGRVVGTDPSTDLGVVKVDATGLTAAQFGDSDELQVGDWVLAVGSPFGIFDNTVTAGIVSAKGRTNLAGPTDSYQDFIQTDAAINPGNSGGPLVNIEGRVVGINAQIASRTGGSEGLGFAIPSSIVRPVMEMLVKGGQVTRGWLGINMAPESGADAGTPGVAIGSVMPDSPAQKSGLKPGDIITGYNGRAMDSINRLRNAIALTAPGAGAELDVLRGGKRVRVPVRITDAPAEPGTAAFRTFGFSVTDLPAAFARRLGGQGVLVNSIDGSSPAARELQPNDVIVQIDDAQVTGPEDFDRIMRNRRQPVRLGVIRPSTGQSGYVDLPPRAV
jgi:serine protease Do